MPTAAVVATTWVDDGKQGKLGDGTRLRWIEFAWTCSDTGAVVSGDTGNLSDPLHGIIDHVITDPDGTDVPTSYNMALVDDAGETHASKTGASTSAVESHTAGKCVAGTLHITIASAGDAKKGVVRVYIRM